MRILARFSKENDLRFISHLDMIHAMERALYRADIPVAYSQGFSPHIKMSFSPPTPLGMPSSAEYLDVHLAKALSAECFIQRMNDALPPDACILEAVALPDDAPNVLGKAAIGRYTLRSADEAAWIAQGQLDLLMDMEAIIMNKETKKGLKEVDIKPCIKDLVMSAHGPCLYAKLQLPSAGGISPHMLLEALNRYAQANIDIDGIMVHKDDILLDDGSRLMGL